MFVLKKIIEPFLIPPGIFLVPLSFISFRLVASRKIRLASVAALLTAVIWGLSISPVSNFLMLGLESDFVIPSNPKGDVIILLGGGYIPTVPDISGTGFPSGDMLGRIVTAARLQKKTGLPIVIASGKVLKTSTAGAPIDRRILVDLGVDPARITLDQKSRDTYENALYSKKICAQMGFKAPILITSAFHMKRAVLSFQLHGMQVLPFPAYRFSTTGRPFYWHHLLPRHYHLYESSMAIREYLAICLYKLSY